jgi:hypothetical protein
MHEDRSADLARIRRALRGATDADLVRGRARRRSTPRRVLLAACVLATAATAAIAADPVSEYPLHGPAANEKAVSTAFDGCIDARGAYETPIAGSNMWAVHISDEAWIACDALYVAREAAGDGYGQAAEQLAKIGTAAPQAFWQCVADAGYDIPGTSEAKPNDQLSHAYGSQALKFVIMSCSTPNGVTVDLTY